MPEIDMSEIAKILTIQGQDEALLITRLRVLGMDEKQATETLKYYHAVWPITPFKRS